MKASDIEKVKQELYELDVIYGKAKAQVLMNATPVYVFEKENKLFRTLYSEEVKYLFEEISKRHCEAIKRLADKYGIEIKDADDKPKEEVEQDKTLSLEETIAMLLKAIPIENVDISMFHDTRSQRELYYSKGEVKIMLKRMDNVKSENIFTYTLRETGLFEKEEDKNESNNN